MGHIGYAFSRKPLVVWKVQWHIMAMFKGYQMLEELIVMDSMVHFWCSGYSISISVCRVWEVKTGVQVFRKELHTHIYVNYAKVEFLSCIKKKKIVMVKT